MNDVSLLAESGNSKIFYKDLDQDLIDIEFYTNTPCVVFIKNGREFITNSDNDRLDLNEGSAVFFPKGINLHSDYVRTSQPLQAYLVFFDDAIIKEYLDSKVTNEDSASSGWFTCSDCPSLDQYFFGLHQYSQQDLITAQLLRLKLLELLELLSQYDTEQRLIGQLRQHQPVSSKRNLQRLLSSDALLKLSVTDLANLSGRSLSSFNRDFKACYDTTPKQWQQLRRLDYGHRLLLQQQLSVTDIALELGYDNVSHFISAFKNKYGVTPKQFSLQSST